MRTTIEITFRIVFLSYILLLKLGYSEKATKFEKIFYLKFYVTDYRQILSGRFFQILWPSQNIRTLISYLQIH